MDHGRPADSPVLDSIRLTASQLKAMAPPNAVSGTRYALPAGASREFVRALTDTPDLTYALRAQDATAAHFEAQVVSVAATEVVVRIHGTLAGDRPSQGAPHSIKSSGIATGLLTFVGNRLESLQIVCDGEYLFPWANSAHSVGGLIEWHRVSR
jgi:hypothetical protein